MAEQNSEEGFGENPFRSLDIKKFPAKRRSEQRVCGWKNNGEDSKLFLDAVERIGRPAKAQSGFLLSEQCAGFKDIEIMKKRKKEKIEKPIQVKKPEPIVIQPVNDPDQEAFQLAMRNTKPISGKGREIIPQIRKKTRTASQDQDFGELINEKYEFTLLYSDEYLEGHAADVDELIMNRLREGKFSHEAHLDLHGLNAMQAFETLRFFMRDSWFKGLRSVLVITGRGHNSPAGQGVLRKRLQLWLTQEPFKRVVAAFCTAKPYDGGPGSIYVLLRKFRKKGRIRWDVLPADADLY